MYVKNIMTTQVITLLDSMTFLDAAKSFLAYKLSGAPVIDKHGQLVGILSEKDLLRAMYPSYNNFYINPQYFLRDAEMESVAESAKEKTIKDIMSPRVIMTTPETHVLKIGGQMVASGIHKVPVVDKDKRLVGMVSRRDVYRAMLQETFHIHTLNNSYETTAHHA